MNILLRLIILAVSVLGIIGVIPSPVYAGSYAGDNRAGFHFVEGGDTFEPYGYTKPPGAYNAGDTFTVKFYVKNDADEARTTYAWLSIYQLVPGTCNTSDNKNVNGIGGTDIPDGNPGLDEVYLLSDEVNFRGTYPDGRFNPPETDNRNTTSDPGSVVCQLHRGTTGRFTYSFTEGETKELTASITLPNASGTGGYYQYDVCFGPWCADQWWDPECFQGSGSGCTYSAAVASPAGFIRMRNPVPIPTNTPIPTPTPLPSVPLEPTGLQATCVYPGDRANISWSAVSGADRYIFRFDQYPNSWNNSCSTFFGNDFCDNNVTSTNTSLDIYRGASYVAGIPTPTWKWWMHAQNAGGNSPATYGPNSSFSSTQGQGVACVPSCYNLSGPTTVVLGQSGKYSARYPMSQVMNIESYPGSAPNPKREVTNTLKGDIAVGQSGSILLSSSSSSGGAGNDVGEMSRSGVTRYYIPDYTSFTWTPSAIGTYDVFCRAFYENISECRGNPNYVSGKPVYTCGGVNTSLSVKVVSPPAINSLTVRNDGGAGGSAVRTSGISSAQGGTGYNNPITITLDVTEGKKANGANASTTYYFAFYSKAASAISSNFVSTLQSRIDSDLRNGALFRYTSAGNYEVYEHGAGTGGGTWTNINGFTALAPYSVCDGSCFYRVAKGSSPKQWYISFNTSFGSKALYTAAFVTDENNLTAFTTGGEITPQVQ